MRFKDLLRSQRRRSGDSSRCSRPRLSLALIALAALGTAGYGQQDLSTDTPEAIVRGAAVAILNAMEGRREYLEANPAELNAIVEQVFLPRFDTAYASFLVLGRHARNASAEQRAQFTTALYNYIVTPLRLRLAEVRFRPARSPAHARRTGR